jgi:hypothetical protein
LLQSDKKALYGVRVGTVRVYTMYVWATLENLVPRGTFGAVYSFDDSITADHDTKFSQDTQAMGLGVETPPNSLAHRSV